MAAAAGYPLTNMLVYALVAIAPTVACWAVLRVPRVGRWLNRHLRATPLAASGPPIQCLAEDIRRVRRLLAAVRPGTPAARQFATRQAYDSLLAQACRALEVEHRLDRVHEGLDRDLERLRVEEALRARGLVIP